MLDQYAVARVLEEIGSLLEILGENSFKARAFHQAAYALEDFTDDFQTLVKEGRLREIPGIGESIAEKIYTLVETGHLPFYEKLKQSIPSTLLELLKVPGLQSKKIKVLYDELGIASIQDLADACHEGKVAKLRGFGVKSQANLLNSIKRMESYGTKMLWPSAMNLAQPILEALSALPEVKKVEIAGSLRRKSEVVGNLNILVASSHPAAVVRWFVAQPWVESVLTKEPAGCSVLLRRRFQADLKIVSEKQFALAWLEWTGSKEHNAQLQQLNVRLEDYPFKKNTTEADLYHQLGLAYIPPELREGMGEVEAAANNTLPHLIEPEDICGVFHCHTKESDGHNTLEEMVAAAQSLGLQYIGIANHSKSSYQANGLSEERLFNQIEQINQLNRSGRFSTYVLAGLECDILTDGALDFSSDVLSRLDYVVASVHRSFQQDEETMTKRIIRAVESPYVTILGHVTGRLLLKREPYAVNLKKVIDACIANGKVMELNAHPIRLDMDWRYWHEASARGLKCAIDPDAHSNKEIEYYRIGVNIARKGWLEKRHILNALSLHELQALGWRVTLNKQ